MTEVLAVPGWKITETTLTAWADALTGQGADVSVTRESSGVSWIEVSALGLRGYAVMAGRHVEAINFELTAADPAPARQTLERAAAALSWELHEDDDEDSDGD